MDTILKVECDGDFRRAVLKGDPNFAAVELAVQEIWPGRTADGAKYIDEEGDSCTLKEQTFTDFIATSQSGANGNMLRLRLPSAAADMNGYRGSSVTTAPQAQLGLGTEEVQEQDADTVQMQADEDDALQPASDQAESYVQEASSTEADFSHRLSVHSMCTPPSSPRGEGSDSLLRQDELNEDADVDRDCSAAIPGTAVFLNPSDHLSYHKESAADYSEAASSEVEESAGDCSKAASSEVEEDVVIDHNVEERIDIILAAFDETGDAHLNFNELNALHAEAWGGAIPIETYQQMCANEGEDPEVGLGRESLMCIYSSCRTLEKDFAAARTKLENLASEEYAEQQRQNAAAANPINLVLKNPLLAVEGATEMLRQGVASTMRRYSR